MSGHHKTTDYSPWAYHTSSRQINSENKSPKVKENILNAYFDDKYRNGVMFPVLKMSAIFFCLTIHSFYSEFQEFYSLLTLAVVYDLFDLYFF